MILLQLFLSFFKIGLFTFGGGYAMLPLIQSEIERHDWMSTTDLVNFVAVSESTPGPFAINISTYVGMILGGLPGALCATLGVALPSFVIILIVARFYEKFKKSKFVTGIMTGLKPAVVGLIGAAIISVGTTVFFPAGLTLTVFSNSSFYVSLGIFLVMLFLSGKKVHPIFIICLSAVLGIGFSYLLL